MEKPYRYFLIHRETNEGKNFINSIRESPILSDVSEWQLKAHGVSEKVQVWDAYEDTRYIFKLRLWAIKTYSCNGLPYPDWVNRKFRKWSLKYSNK